MSNFKEKLNHDYNHSNKILKVMIGLFFTIAISCIIFLATSDLWK
jgi:hypothetical protein